MSGMADPGRGHLGLGGAGPDPLRTPGGNGGFRMQVGTGGAEGLSYLAGWGPLGQQPLWWDGGWGEAGSTAPDGAAEVKALPGDQLRPGGRETGHLGRRREAWRGRAEQASGREEGLTPRWEKGLGSEAPQAERRLECSCLP